MQNLVAVEMSESTEVEVVIAEKGIDECDAVFEG